MTLDFSTLSDAWNWLFETVNDPFVENLRFAYLDDQVSMIKYQEQVERGRFEFFDHEVQINGRKASIGCNYGS